MLLNRRNIAKRRDNESADDFSFSVQSSPSVLSKLNDKLSPRRRKLRKERLALELVAAEKEREVERLRARPLTQDEKQRYEQLQVKKYDILIQNQRVVEVNNGHDNIKTEQPYLYETSSFDIRGKDKFMSSFTMKDKFTQILYIFSHLLLMFIVYDKNVTNRLMNFDDNMCPIVMFVYLAVFVNIYNLIGLYAVDTIEGNDQATVFQSTLIFVRRHLILFSVLIYITCWLICAIPQICTAFTQVWFERRSNFPLETGILSQINWFQLQCDTLDQVKVLLKYISSFSISCVLFVESVAHHMQHIYNN